MKQKITLVGSIIAVILILFSLKSLFTSQSPPPPSPVTQNETPKIVSTKPEPLEDTVIAATQTIEISFNRTLQNAAEFKLRIEPETDYRVELSGDRKTAKIIPNKPYPLGTTFTLFIGPETKFDGVGKWGEEKVFHFRTIKYTGV